MSEQRPTFREMRERIARLGTEACALHACGRVEEAAITAAEGDALRVLLDEAYAKLRTTPRVLRPAR